MTTDQKYLYYAQAVGTNTVQPVKRTSEVPGRPMTIWCPFCDTSAQVGFSAVCVNCKSMWLDGALVDAEVTLSAALGRPLNLPVAPVPPPAPVFPDRDDDGGFGEYSNEQLGERGDKARVERDLDTMISISEELEARHRKRVEAAAAPTVPDPAEDIVPFEPRADDNETDDAEPPAPSRSRKRSRSG